MSIPDRPLTLLIATSVGPDAVATALRLAQPARILIWHSEGGHQEALASLEMAGFDQDNADFRPVTRKRDLQSCVADMRAMHEDYLAWVSRSPQHRVVVEFIGGTSAMSAAMVLVAHRWDWDCQFLNIAGLQGIRSVGPMPAEPETPPQPVSPSDPAYFRRPWGRRGGAAIGQRPPPQPADPYNALAYQPLQDAVQLFNRGQTGAAWQLLDAFAKRRDLAPTFKRQFIAVQNLANAYSQWDNFRYGEAVASFDVAIGAGSDLAAAIPRQNLAPTLERHRELCLGLAQANPSRAFVTDLLANADRRADDRRFDDAAARLHRAAGAMAQVALSTDHEIDANGTRLDQLPTALKKPWKPRVGPDGLLKLSLNDAFTLLHELKHPLGVKFRELNLHEPTSPLSARDQSVLVYGVTPVTDKAFGVLRDCVHQLADKPDLAPYAFPRLSIRTAVSV